MEHHLLLVEEQSVNPRPTPHPSLLSAKAEFARLHPHLSGTLLFRHSQDPDRTVFYDLSVLDEFQRKVMHAVGVIVTMEGRAIYTETIRRGLNEPWVTESRTVPAAENPALLTLPDAVMEYVLDVAQAIPSADAHDIQRYVVGCPGVGSAKDRHDISVRMMAQLSRAALSPGDADLEVMAELTGPALSYTQRRLMAASLQDGLTQGVFVRVYHALCSTPQRMG